MEIIYVSKIKSKVFRLYWGCKEDLLAHGSHLSIGGPLRAQHINHGITHYVNEVGASLEIIGPFGNLMKAVDNLPRKMDINTYT